MAGSKLEDWLNRPIYAIEARRMISAVSDFLQFSEAGIEARYRQELRDIGRREAAEDLPFEHSEHLKENARFRHEISLPLNVRYSAVVGLVTSVEWSIRPFVERLREPILPRPKGCNETVHALSQLSVRTGVGTADLIADYRALVRVRHCIAHNAGMIDEYRYASGLAEATDRLAGFSLDSRNLFGRHVCIERDALPPYIEAMHDFIVGSKKAAHEQGLVSGRQRRGDRAS